VTDAVVVGAGPNGLAAAVAIAQAGYSVTVYEGHDTIGGGTRTEELLVPGVLHDVCSAVHPFGGASPFLQSLGLEAHGLKWAFTELEMAHPLDGGRAGVLARSLEDTATGFGDDARAWRRSFGPVARNYTTLIGETFQPLLHVPRHPLAMARFGLGAVLPATTFAKRFKSDEARALLMGVAAHSFQPLTRPLTAAVALMFVGAAHTTGWPVAIGGSRAITDALASLLRSLGGTIETGAPVASLDALAPHRVALLDVTPTAAIRIVGDRMPARVRRAYSRWKYGPAAFKVDFVVEGGVPWANEACRRAGTVHCGGTMEEVAAAEAAAHGGRMPERPYVLVGQQYLADPSRSAGDRHPIWAYAHVPHGYTGDATDAVLDQLERFAPGLRERIVAIGTTTPAQYEAYNPNYVGGDIASGDNSPRQTVLKPRLALDPYRIADDVFLCSQSTPPGAGVHGMCGANAARSAIKQLGASAG
jgi:phytoene dehydrogenase-like protein